MRIWFHHVLYFVMTSEIEFLFVYDAGSVRDSCTEIVVASTFLKKNDMFIKSGVVGVEAGFVMLDGKYASKSSTTPWITNDVNLTFSKCTGLVISVLVKVKSFERLPMWIRPFLDNSCDGEDDDGDG